MLVEQLRQEWRTRRIPRNFQETLCFKADRLELGSGTVLAKTDAASAGGDQRLTALLAVAYGPVVAAGALGHVRAAIARRKAGDPPAADLHLALSRLDRLRHPENASRRLFMADGLMRGGVSPEAIMEVLQEAASEGAGLIKYSADQPRVPSGSGRASGEWTSGDTQAAKPTRPASALRPQVGQISSPASSASDGASPKTPAVVSAPSAQAPTGDGVDTDYITPAAYAAPVGAAPALSAFGKAALKRLFEFLIASASPEVAAAVVFFGTLAIPSGGPKGRWVYVGGPGDVSYYQNPDETRLILKYSTQDGRQHTVNLTPDQNGDYRDPDGNILARTLKAAAKTGIVVSTAELLGEQPGQPQLCPKPTMGRNQGPYGKAYEAYMKARLNDPPTPPDLAYYLRDPFSGNLVEFDDCDWDKPGLHEYKGRVFRNTWTLMTLSGTR